MFLTLAYGAVNMIELVNHGKSTIRLDVIDFYYEESYKFDLDKKPGLNVAFGVTYYDDNPEAIDIDPDYGELTAYVKSWGPDFLKFRKLKLRPCTPEELGLEEKDGKFTS